MLGLRICFPPRRHTASRGLLTPHSDEKVSPLARGLLRGAPVLTAAGLIPASSIQLEPPRSRGAIRSGRTIAGSYPGLLALTVYNGELIAAGLFTTADGVVCNNIARWNGVTWQPLADGTNGSVNALTVYSGELIAGGWFTTAGGVVCSCLARWNGVAWQCQSPDGGTSGAVHALAVYGGALIVGGEFSFAGDVHCEHIAGWDGANWQPLEIGMSNTVYALAVYNGELIAGGAFGRAGHQLCRRIARWAGLSWAPLGDGMGGYVYALDVYASELTAGGAFATAGDQVSAYWGRWRCVPVIGDMNCDATVDFADINPFVAYLSNFADWQADFPGCPPENGDINGDGTYGQGSFDDINPFVELLTGGA